MKRTAIISLLLAIALILTGCEPKLPYARCMHSPEPITKGDSVSVNAVELGEGYINVEVELNFTTLMLNDFESISVKKSESGAPTIMCSTEKTKEQNGEEIFDKIYSGKAVLCFEDSSISPDDEFNHYMLNLFMVWENGAGRGFEFCLYEDE